MAGQAVLDTRGTNRLPARVMGSVKYGSSRLRCALWLAAAMAISGCDDSSRASPTAGSDPMMVETSFTTRQGPFRVTCYKDEAIVFEHGTIYRVYQPEGADAGWSYETGDGLKFRGRIGENVNCVWQSR